VQWDSMMSRDDGSRKIGGREIGEGPYESEGRQATLTEKRVSVTVEFKIAFREITPETALEMGLSRDLAEVQGDGALVETVEMQGRLLRALLEDEEALRQFIACAVIEEVAAGQGELLREGLKVRSEEEALRPVIEALGGEVVEYYAGVEEGVMFAENIELLIFSTPVRCLGVRGRVVDMDEDGGDSDKHLT
jgi:hypothetical protein